MAGQTKAGNIRAGVNVKLKSGIHGGPVQQGHDRKHILLDIPVWQLPRSHCIEQYTGPQRLGKDQRITGLTSDI